MTSVKYGSEIWTRTIQGDKPIHFQERTFFGKVKGCTKLDRYIRQTKWKEQFVGMVETNQNNEFKCIGR